MRRAVSTQACINVVLGCILADPAARDTEYARSRALLSVIASKFPVDAVLYPSVKDATAHPAYKSRARLGLVVVEAGHASDHHD